MPKIRITQRYATRSAGIVSLPAASRLEIFGSRRVQFEIDREPESFRIAYKPDAEYHGDRNHDPKCQGCALNFQDVMQNRPRSERGKDGECVSNRNVRKKISTLTHEEIAATGAADRTVEVPFEQLSFS